MSGDSTESTAAPSTADVARDVVESYEGSGETSTDTSLETTDPSTTETATVTDATAPGVVLSEEEALLREFGFTHATKPDGRQHYIPRDKVLKMIGSGLKRGKEKWTGERSSLDSRVQEMTQALTEYQTLIKGDPHNFLRELSSVDPRYQAFLQQQKQETPAPKAEDDPEPQPDYDLGNGQYTYSVQGLQKLRAWERRQLQREVDDKLKPFHEREQAAREREKFEQANHQLATRTKEMMAEALTWPGWKEHEPEILKALQEDSAKARAEHRRPTLSLDAAYRQAVLPKLTADRNAMREQLMKELDTAAKASPTIARAGAETTKGQKLTTQDIARKVIADLERGA